MVVVLRSDDKKKKENKKRSIVWQHEDVNTSVNSICPFTVDRSIVYTCQFGKGRKAQPKENSQVNTCNKQLLQV